MSVENILYVYKMATPEEKRDGVVWYAEALSACTRIAIDLDLPVHIVTGVVSALSPNNKWDRNVTNARDLCQAFIDGEDMDSVKVSTYGNNKRKAWSILEDMLEHEDIIDRLKGQKTTSFYRNIMGDDTCTIDGHARNIAYGERVGLTDDKTNIGVKEYRTLQAEYVAAAKRTRVNGRALKAFELQAITWVTWRRIHNIK